MTTIHGVLLCVAYIVGLLVTAVPGTWHGISGGAIALLVIGVLCAAVVPRRWRTGPRYRVWLVATLCGFLATFYLQGRSPQPSALDISQWTNPDPTAAAVSVEVRGWIDTPPQLNRNQRIRFEVRVKAARRTGNESPSSQSASAETIPVTTAGFQPMTGKLYVTVPLLQGTGLFPTQQIELKGSLYRPKPADTPGGFDFQEYLQQQGIFAGLNASEVATVETGRSPSPISFVQHLLWKIQQRIIQRQVTGLGIPEGPLVSAMVMGRRGVDLDFDLRDQFARVGLAHALAASGFHVSLLLGTLLVLTKRLSGQWKLVIGLTVLVLYIGLTGAQPSILRASFMGAAALLGLALERKVKPLGSLLAAATILLVINPLWIWDLGFQFSFLATLGLLVTVPTLTAWLDWVPSRLAPLLAVPIAAYLWTLPTQLFVFGVVSPYSIPVNLLATPLITVVSLGGMGTALLSCILPSLGAIAAGLLYYPTHWLILLVQWTSGLPGSAWAVGRISIVQLLVLYSLFLLVWWRSPWQKRWWGVAIAAIVLVALPAWQVAAHLQRVTVLATTEPVLVVQDRGQVGLINAGTEADIDFAVLPFLRQAGVNHLDWAIAADSAPTDTQWLQIVQAMPINTLFGAAPPPPVLSTDTAPTVDATTLQRQINHQALLSKLQSRGGAYQIIPQQPFPIASDWLTLQSLQPNLLTIQLSDQRGLLLNDVSLEQQNAMLAQNPAPVDLLWWAGEEPQPALLDNLQPKVAIAIQRSLSPNLQTWLETHQVIYYLTEQAGSLQWTPQKGFIPLSSSSEL